MRPGPCGLSAALFLVWALGPRERSFAGQPGLGSLRGPAASAPRHGQATAALQQTAVESQVAKPTDISEDDAARFEEAGYSVRSAVYGTVPAESTEDLFEVVRDITKQQDVERFLKGGIFLDLGSGEGELVVNALTQYPKLRRSVGVELCGDRHQVAVQRAEQLPDDLQERTRFIEGDICDDADPAVREAIASARVIFIGSVMFEAPLMKRLSGVLQGHAARRDRSTVIVSFGKQLDLGDRPSAFSSGLMTGSWGLAPIYAYGLLPSS